jgi:hypothetical protein
MSDEFGDLDERDGVSAEWYRISKLDNFDEYFKAARAYWRDMLIRRFGSDLLTLSASEAEVLDYVKSGDPERMRMALERVMNCSPVVDVG